MPERNLDLTITRRGRKEDTLDLLADPNDIGTLQKVLKGWLEANKWHAGRWGEFEMEIRYAGEGKVRAKVRA